jgi:hypothetical protein
MSMVISTMPLPDGYRSLSGFSNVGFQVEMQMRYPPEFLPILHRNRQLTPNSSSLGTFTHSTSVMRSDPITGSWDTTQYVPKLSPGNTNILSPRMGCSTSPGTQTAILSLDGDGGNRLPGPSPQTDC